MDEYQKFCQRGAAYFAEMEAAEAEQRELKASRPKRNRLQRPAPTPAR
jgi:hypothetical protein